MTVRSRPQTPVGGIELPAAVGFLVGDLSEAVFSRP